MECKDAKLCPTHFPSGCKLQVKEGKLLPKLGQYRRLVDIRFEVQQLSHFMGCTTTQHWAVAVAVAQRVLRYLRGTSHIKLPFPSN